MPQWKVIGVDAETGMESSLVVEASTESVARIMAERRGIIVAEVANQSALSVLTDHPPIDGLPSHRINPATAEFARRIAPAPSAPAMGEQDMRRLAAHTAKARRDQQSVSAIMQLLFAILFAIGVCIAVGMFM